MGEKLIAENRRARHDYHLLDRFEAGLVLTGTEVKSLRDGRATLAQAYADIRDGEAWLNGLEISTYDQGNRANHEPMRARKLLLHRRQIDSLYGKVREKGLTIVPDAALLQGLAGEDRAGGRARQGAARQAPGRGRARREAPDGAGAEGPEPLDPRLHCGQHTTYGGAMASTWSVLRLSCKRRSPVGLLKPPETTQVRITTSHSLPKS